MKAEFMYKGHDDFVERDGCVSYRAQQDTGIKPRKFTAGEPKKVKKEESGDIKANRIFAVFIALFYMVAIVAAIIVIWAII